MALEGLTRSQVAELQKPHMGLVRLDRALLQKTSKEILRLLEWEGASQVDLQIRNSITTNNRLPYWEGGEGFVFGLDVTIDGHPQEKKSGGRLLLKVFHDGVVTTSADGDRRELRASFLCEPSKNLHLRLITHPPSARALFAGAPVMSFRHSLGFEGNEFVCYVMHNANAHTGHSVLQWRELRQERLLSAQDRIWLAHDLARCVGIMEELGLTHCDICPDNVLISLPNSAAERPKVCLVDFDFFCSLGCPVLPMHEAPPTGGCPGHDGYLPPKGMSLFEINGQQQVRYDRFALGLLILEILAWTDITWDFPLIPQDRIDCLTQSANLEPSLLGCLQFLLGASIRGLMQRVLSANSGLWPSPQEWIGALERPGVFGLCINPMRSWQAEDRQQCICAFPATEAFGEWIAGRSAADCRQASGESRMRRVIPGGWTFTEPQKRTLSPQGIAARLWQRLGSPWQNTAVQPFPHFRWMKDVRGAELMRRKVEGLSHCPVCGSPLSIDDQLKA